MKKCCGSKMYIFDGFFLGRGRGMDRGSPHMGRGGRGGGFQGRGGQNFGGGPMPLPGGTVKRGAPVGGGPPMPAKRGRFDSGHQSNGYSHHPQPV